MVVNDYLLAAIIMTVDLDLAWIVSAAKLKLGGDE